MTLIMSNSDVWASGNQYLIISGSTLEMVSIAPAHHAEAPTDSDMITGPITVIIFATDVDPEMVFPLL